jgi:hypothetical protein
MYKAVTHEVVCVARNVFHNTKLVGGSSCIDLLNRLFLFFEFVFRVAHQIPVDDVHLPFLAACGQELPHWIKN